MPEPQLLTRGSAQAQAIGAGGNIDLIIECGGDSTLVVEADMSAGAAPDLAVQVNPVNEPDMEIFPIPQPAVQSVGPTLNGGRSYFWGMWDITAQNRVRVRITNNNAGAQSADYSWRLA